MVPPGKFAGILSSTPAWPPGCSLAEAEAAARASMVKIGPYKRLFVRIIEVILYPLVRGLDVLRSFGQEPSKEIRRILVVEYWNLGDIVMILPLLQNLRIHYPNAHIALMTNPRLLPLLEGQEVVNEVIPVRVPWAQHFSRWRKVNPFSAAWLELARCILFLRGQKFDLALSGRPDVRDNLILWLAGAQRRVGYAFAGGRFFLTDVATPDLRHPHQSELWLNLLEHLGKPILDRQPHLKLGSAEEGFAEQYLAERGIQNGDCVVGIHPGARIPTRRWGDQNFRLVADGLTTRFAVKILWFQEPNAADGAACVPHGSIPAALPLRQFMAVLARCQLLICNESGPMHIATALGVPVVAIFGAMDPAWSGPLGEKNRLVIRRGFWCRPCFDRCIFDQPYCLRAIPANEVLEATVSSIQSLSIRKLARTGDGEGVPLRMQRAGST